MKNSLIYISWLLLSLVILSIGIYSLESWGSLRVIGKIHRSKVKEVAPRNLYQIYSSVPPINHNSESSITAADARSEYIRKYLEKYQSPFKQFYNEILYTSDTHKNDQFTDLWRYILAIGQCESNLGKRIPGGSYNAWGLGIVTGANRGLSFTGWPEAIDYEAKFLRKLIDQNRLTLEQWAEVYAPPSLDNDHSWAKCVSHFLDEIQ